LRQVLLLSIVLQFAALATPFYLQLAVDTAFPSFDADLLRMLAIGFGGLVLINMLTSWLRSLILVSLGNSLSYQVVVNLYRHLLRLPLPWFEKRHVGDILSRFGSTKPISDLLSQGLIAAIIDGVMAFLTLALMLIYSPLLALVAVVAWGLYAALKVGFIHSLRASNLNAITAAAKENSAFIESIRGISALKAFGQEGNRQRIWQQLKADSVNADMQLGRLSAGFDAGGQLILGIERVLFVYLAITMAMGGSFTVGMIFAFQAYKQQFLDASTRLIEQAVRYRLLDLHLHRIADIALSKSEHGLEGLGDFVHQLSTDIELKDLCFRYGAGEPEILKTVNLKVAEGEMIAFTGPSGGGKTTLLKLMMGLYEPTSGKLVIGGKTMERGHLPSWRKRIASVAQDDMLFAGSLAENIAFFDPEIDMAAVERAARLAAIHQDIAAMPLGYETLVGDMGSALSGGQKQRVLLARALYAEPDILFVDEGTAHLDAQSEAAVMAALADLKITRIFVAHRSRAIAAADKIYVVRNGSVVPSSELRPAAGEPAVSAG
jgi:ATP-binding cassette subfamily B protein RaxB